MLINSLYNLILKTNKMNINKINNLVNKWNFFVKCYQLK